MLTLGIRTKILLIIMAATLLPLLFLNVFWTNSQRQALINEARSRQTLIAGSDAEQVNDFINNKVRTLIIHSQSPSLQQFNLSKASLEIGTLLYQDKDLMRAALVDQTGQEVVAMTSDLKSATKQNVKNDDAFKVVNYFGGNQYLSPVTTDANGHPMMTIAIPLVTFTTPQELGSLSTAESGVVRNPQDIKGALIVQTSLENLWHTVLSTTGTTDTPGGGYAYVVNDKGIVIAHPDEAFTNTHKDLSATPIVSLFKTTLGNANSTTQSQQSASEKGVEVMATYQKVNATDWAVIFEEPMSSIYQAVSQVSYLGLAISAIAIVVLGFLSVWLSRYITQPILTIARAAKKIGHGDFAAQVMTRRKDEIGTLAANINAMGDNLQAYIGRIDTQRRQLAIILNSTADGILALDSTNSIIIANQATALLCKDTADALIGKKIQDIFPLTKKSHPFILNYQAATTDVYTNLEYKDPEDALHYIDLIVVQAANQTIVTIHDETKSRELDTMKVDFVSIAAHELRTPLSRIRGSLELMDASDSDSSAKYVAEARKSAEELSTLISNLLDVSRIEESTLALATEKVDLALDITQAVKDMQMSAKAKDITLEYSGNAESEYVVGNSIALREVIDNLIDNAIKYTPEKGHVVISLERRDAVYMMRVQDDGIGIPMNARPYLFTKFYRVHNGSESGNTGTGLGLFITRSIVERHNGTITVDSKGQGSVFTVTIPVFNEATFAATHKLKGGEYDAGHRGWTTKDITRRR